MDAQDPRVDYLFIDDMISLHRYDEVDDYIRQRDLNKLEVMKTWYVAAKPDGILINDCYFHTYEMNRTRTTYDLVHERTTINATTTEDNRISMFQGYQSVGIPKFSVLLGDSHYQTNIYSIEYPDTDPTYCYDKKFKIPKPTTWSISLSIE